MAPMSKRSSSLRAGVRAGADGVEGAAAAGVGATGATASGAAVAGVSGSSFLIISTWGGLRTGAAGFGRAEPGGTGRGEAEPPEEEAGAGGCWLPGPAIDTDQAGISHCKDANPQDLSSPSQRRLELLPAPAAADLAGRRGSTVVWPFGAVEQHGPHLPLGTDALFSDRVLDAVLQRLPAEAPILRLPLQAIGFSPEHRSFAGTLTLSAELVLQLVLEVGRGLARTGFQRLVLFNGHGGQIGLLQVAARQLRDACPELAVLPCFLWSGPEGVWDPIPEPERSQGLHAGLGETSLMLHLASELVGPERPVDGRGGPAIPEGWSLEGAAPCAWLTSDVSSSGVIGDARGASAALGEQLFEALVEGWRRRFLSLLTSDWPAPQSH